MNDFQELINHSHDMAEKLLLEQNGEFYPFGAEIDMYGELTHTALYRGDEFPPSQTMLTDFREYFENKIKENNMRAYAITFDCLAKRDSDSDKTDAIAIECFSKQNGQRTTYYFPYKLVTNDNLEFGESWGITTG